MSDSQWGCQCCPNKGNGMIIATQVLSIVAFAIGAYPGIISGFPFFSMWFQFAVFWVSLIVLVLYQVLWCVAVPKGVHWALAFLSLFLAASNLGSGIWSLSRGWYWEMPVLWLVPGALWLTVAILEFIILCKKDESEDEEEDLAKEEDV